MRTDRVAADGTGAVVDVAGVVHVFRVAGTDVAALRGVDLHVDAGEQVALLGPSGSGKSTLLSVVAGLRRPSAGSVSIDGRNIARATEKQLYDYRASTVGLMLQDAAANLLPYTSAQNNVSFVTGESAAADIVLEAAGLIDVDQPVGTLGRAAQQSAALAVAMARAPRLLLVDEPTSQLDPAERDALLEVMRDVARASATTLLVVTHDEEVARRLGRSVRMSAGRVGAEGERHDQYAVIGRDGFVQLPEEILAMWPPGSRLELKIMSEHRVHLDLRDQGGPS